MRNEHQTDDVQALCTDTILLIGAGGVGAPLSIHLGNLSRQLVILDHDIYEKHNMNRQPIARGNVGQAKVHCLAKALAPWCSADIIPVVDKFTEENSTALLGMFQPDLIVVAVDNDPARKAIWAHAKDYDILWGANELWEPQAGLSLKSNPWNPAECFKPAEGGTDPICGEQTIKANLAASNLASFLIITALEENKVPFSFASKQAGLPLYTIDRDEL